MVTLISESALKSAFKQQEEPDGTMDTKTFKSVVKSCGLDINEPAVLHSISDIADGNLISNSKLGDFIVALNANIIKQKNMRKIFDMIDADKNGTLDRYEIKMAFAMLGKPFTEADVEALMKEADLDNDGIISFDEFRGCKGAEIFADGLA